MEAGQFPILGTCNHWPVCATLRLLCTRVLLGGWWPFAAIPAAAAVAVVVVVVVAAAVAVAVPFVVVLSVVVVVLLSL